VADARRVIALWSACEAWRRVRGFARAVRLSVHGSRYYRPL